MFVHRKPHPKGNEYHTICCGESRIIYRWELVEGKDIPKELGRPEFETGPGTNKLALMWRMTEPLRGTGKKLIIYSGLCVLKGLIGMYKIGVYGSIVVNKRRYWTSAIYGDQINAHFVKN